MPVRLSLLCLALIPAPRQSPQSPSACEGTLSKKAKTYSVSAMWWEHRVYLASFKVLPFDRGTRKAKHHFISMGLLKYIFGCWNAEVKARINQKKCEVEMTLKGGFGELGMGGDWRGWQGL